MEQQINPPYLFLFTDSKNPRLHCIVKDEAEAVSLYDYMSKQPINVVMTADREFLIRLHIYRDINDRIEPSIGIDRWLISNRIEFWDIENLSLKVTIGWFTPERSIGLEEHIQVAHFKCMDISDFKYQPL